MKCGSIIMEDPDKWKYEKYHELRMKDPELCPYSKFSSKKWDWICDCGKTANLRMASVTTGNNKACGKCYLMPASWWAEKKFGKLRMLDPQEHFQFSKTKVDWVCDCGNVKNLKIQYVTNLHTTSCGKCGMLTADHFKSTKYGKLRLKSPRDLSPGSYKKETWVCDCGQEKAIPIHSVVLHGVESCGRCHVKPQSEPDQVRSTLNNTPSVKLDVKGPTLSVSTRSVAVPIVYGTSLEFRACVDDFRLNGDEDLYNAVAASERTPQLLTQISEFIRSLGLDTQQECEISGCLYGIFAPSHNLLIDCNSLRSRSSLEERKRDQLKYQTTKNLRLDYIMLFEDEWIHNQQKVRDLLRNKLTKSNPISIRPSKCKIREISSAEANSLYEEHHYIGKVRSSKVSYGVFFEDRLIGAVSFSHPTRQSYHPWELIRMCGVPDVRVHGIWSKIVQRFVRDYNPSSIVSFSDNRLFSGGVYEKIGFRFDGDVVPDYYWTMGTQRFHKSGLRKTEEEKLTGLTETQLREAQGYKKIWDLGKKRWVLD